MDGNAIAKKILNESFPLPDKLPNEEYLDTYIIYLESLALGYKRESENREVSQLQRARARDFEQNCYGLINGIKFGISFFYYRDIDLLTHHNQLKEESEITGG